MRISIDWTVRLSKGVYPDPGDVDLEYFIDGKLHETIETPVRGIQEYGLLHFYRGDIGLAGNKDHSGIPDLWRETQSGIKLWYVPTDD